VPDDTDVAENDMVDLSQVALGDIDTQDGSRLEKAIARLLSTGTDTPVAGFNAVI